MRLQIADPEHEFGDRRGSWVKFETEVLVRVDGQAFGFETLLGPASSQAKSVQLIEYLAFEALHVFERDVEEIRRAVGRIEHAHLAQAVMESIDLGARGIEPALGSEQQRCRLDVALVAAQRFDDGRQHSRSTYARAV
ncbi:MAG: hypothetical protein IPJ27_15090 [Candidatus Accumulibacter sp.]|uniref:Uncharacterized protein n=1 Tax=Candidatus Accumulibacter proximus TaxID=2954385 RepID=A0A935UHW9_9PROT|nr:hypothetical protein [Candidatus Accumulibacter proximus]